MTGSEPATGSHWLNGWRRLWIAVTGIALLTAIVSSWILAHEYNPSEFEYEQILRVELERPACALYTSRPMSELTEPIFRTDGSTCWYIYTSRRYSETGRTPYTLDVYIADRAAYRFKQFLIGLAFFGGVSLLASLIVYCVGYVIAWVRVGFLRT